MNPFRRPVMTLRSLPDRIRLFWPVYALVCFGSIVGVRDSSAAWIEQIVNVQTYIAVVQAVSHEIVWAVGNSARVFVTTDGGENWVSRTVPGAVNVRGLFAFNHQEAVVADQQGHFFRTTDSGVQWTPVHGPTGSSINGIHFFDELNGWAMGDPVNGHYVILLSTDGGWSWTASPNAPPGTTPSTVRSYDWIGTQIGVFSTRDWVIWRTTNAGAQWDSVGVDYQVSNGIELSNTGIGLSAGGNGGDTFLRRSTDSGATWSPIVHPPQATSMRNFDWIEGTSEVWGATNQTGVFQSTNEGIDWVRHIVPSVGFAVGDIDFIDQETGWCVGGITPGRVFRWTTTAGITLSPVAPPQMDALAYPNPFRSELILEIATPNRAPAEWAVYDVTEHKIWNGVAPAGAVRHRWDGRDRSGRPVPSGTYFYRLQSGEHELTGRIVKVP